MNEEKSLSLLQILKSVLFALVLIGLLLMGFALIITHFEVPQALELPVCMVITLLGIFVAGLGNARGARKNGWLCGTVAGAICILVLYVTAMLAFHNAGFDRQTLTMTILGALAGAAGGIFGINTKKRASR